MSTKAILACTLHEGFTLLILSDPYSSIVINGTATPSCTLPPFLTGVEILQLLNDPMAQPTSAFEGIIT
jgi:hypothetical protein